MNKNDIQNQLTKESIFKIGVVSSVSGRSVQIKVNKNKNASHLIYNGDVLKNISVNSYVKISKGFTKIIGKVEGERIESGKFFNREYNKEEDIIERFLEVSLFGHFEGHKFEQGIKEMPLVDNECYLLDREEFGKLHQFYGVNKKTQQEERTITIGCLADEPAQEIKVAINKLFASHIGIFGNTGSGKSNTLARIYFELFKKIEEEGNFKEKSKFVIIDFNGEYGEDEDNIITKNKKVYTLSDQDESAEKYPINSKSIEKLEIISVLLEASEKVQKPFLDRALKNTYLDDKFQIRANENIDKLINDILQKADGNHGVNIFEEIFFYLNKIEKKQTTPTVTETILENLRLSKLKFFPKKEGSSYYIGEKTSASDNRIFSDSNLEGVKDAIFPNLKDLQISEDNFGKIIFKILSQYYHELITGNSNAEYVRYLIGRMFRKFELLSRLLKVENNSAENNLEIINLKNVDSIEMTKTLPLIICKELYFEHKNDENFKTKSLHIIIDEAHNILSDKSDRESESWKDYRLETFEEIVKEGRKFNTFLTIASQRPQDISSTVISQLHNYFIHKLINDFDINAIHKTVAYLDKLSFESIPILSVGNCFFAGVATNLPVKLAIAPLDEVNRPNSENVDLESIWELGTGETDAKEEV